MRLLPLLLLIISGCNGPTLATVKGGLVLNGQPFALPPGAGEVFIVFRKLNSDGSIDAFQMYSAVVKPDGRFEVVSSGGSLPVGEYQMSIDAAAGKVEQFKPFALAITKSKVEFKPGANDIAIELAKP